MGTSYNVSTVLLEKCLKVEIGSKTGNVWHGSTSCKEEKRPHASKCKDPPQFLRSLTLLGFVNKSPPCSAISFERIECGHIVGQLQ